MSVRLVLDSSVVIAAMKPGEPEHRDALGLLDRLRALEPSGDVALFGPSELWLEVHVHEQRLAASRRGGPPPEPALAGLSIELVAPESADAVMAFLDHLARRMRGRKHGANATDLCYVWAAHAAGATLVTLDRGLLGYHGAVCDVCRPEHALWGAQGSRG